ncbi:MAG: hypothetical protein ACK4UO_18345 [Pseudolabrys sp.]
MLLTGIVLFVIGVGALFVSIPRGGKYAWFVDRPFLEPAAPILMIFAIVSGAILVAGHLLEWDIGLTRASSLHDLQQGSPG